MDFSFHTYYSILRDEFSREAISAATTERPATPSLDELPKPRNLQACFAGLIDLRERG